MRRNRWTVGVLAALLLAGCGDDGSTAADPTSSTPPDPDVVFAGLMDANAPGWPAEFAVEGATVDDAPALAILAAQASCTELETRSVEEVLLNLLAGSLPADTAGTLLYAAAAAYCPTYSQAVQDYADANR